MTPDFVSSAHAHQDLSEDEQKKAGQAIAGSMGDEYTNFLTIVIALIDSGEINSADPQTLLNKDVYDGLPQEWKDKTDLALSNISSQLGHIEAFHRDPDTPDSSPQLQTMIEHLWQMKQRIEEHHDVFKF